MTEVNALVQSGEMFIEELDEFLSMRDKRYGICKTCKRYRTATEVCYSCDTQLSDKTWTSGNKEIDDFIKENQRKPRGSLKIIEWIPFDRLEDVKKIGEGGFSTVYSAIWLDGKRTISGREQRTKVAFKSLGGDNFIKEFKAHVECHHKGGSLLEIYGITYFPAEENYMMVFQYADGGNLRDFVQTNFETLTWYKKLEILALLAFDLGKIHKVGYMHRDFHSGNILQVAYKSEIGDDIGPRICDLGLSKKIDDSTENEGIFGVVPYVAPEVLLGKPFTKASDIYSLGIIMTEVSTGKPPFDGIQHNADLILKICGGLRPAISKGTPERYVKLAMRCMDTRPENRPDINHVHQELFNWWVAFWKDGMLSEEELEIRKDFLEADKMIPLLSKALTNNSDSIFKSQFINTKKISKAFNPDMDTSQINLNIEDFDD
ncbi:kinase-like domain-containing protein [Gigaspora rosea]|uniref:Kinase-like domain-containing protein n=1 Tax=Gigaspora rosea TaxID=44941 RepID=A0A397TSD8_9GLOM|nr:kinase-like domain-containing protein [Gigaspora rosea]